MYIRRLLLLPCLLLAGELMGQQNLSLSEAIRYGLDKNYDIRIEQGNVQIAKNNNTWGVAGAMPTITLDVNQANSFNDNVKTASPFQLQDLTISNSLTPAINLNWTLFNGFQVKMGKRKLAQIQNETEGNASIVIANTIQGIIMAYYSVVVENDRLREFERQLSLSRDKFTHAKVKSEIGSGNTTDLLVEEGNFLSDSINYINQQYRIKNEIRKLNIFLNEPNPDTPWTLTDEMYFDMHDYSYDALADKMLNGNVDLKKQYLTQSILRTDVSSAESARYPSLRLTAGVSENRSSVDLSKAKFPGDTPSPADRLNAVTDRYFGNLALSYTLFNGGKIKNEIRNAALREDIGNIRLERMKLSLEKDLRDALDLYNVRKQIYQINLRREEVAQINLTNSEEKYKQGVINSFDFRVIQNAHLSAAILRLSALYSLVDSHTTLMRLTGGLIEDYGQ